MKDNRDGKSKNWCEWMRYTVDHPKEIVHNMTIRSFLQLQTHVRQCNPCRTSLELMLKKYPAKVKNLFSQN